MFSANLLQGWLRCQDELIFLPDLQEVAKGIGVRPFTHHTVFFKSERPTRLQFPTLSRILMHPRLDINFPTYPNSALRRQRRLLCAWSRPGADSGRSWLADQPKT